MDSSPLPSPTSLEDSSKKEENSFIFDELDFLIQLDDSPPSLFELLPNFLGDESSCLAEQDYRGLKEVVSDQEECLPLPEEPVNQEKPPCRDEAAGKIIQQQCTEDGEKSETSILDSISTQLIFSQVVSKDSLNVVTRLHDNNNLQALNSWNDDAEFNPSMLLGNSTPMITGDNDSYKRGCACKKIKCLKAYCGCFADGFKCTEFCTCIRCSNRPEYQVAIDNAKQKQKAISRKPVASVSETQNDSATNILPLKNEEEEDVNPYSKIEDFGEKFLLPADLHHNIMHHVSHPTPPKLQDFGMSWLPPKNVTQHLTPLTNFALMSGASRDWRHSNGNSLFGDPLITPHTSTTPTTIMTRFGRLTSQQSLESSNPVSFAFNTEQNATSTSPNIMEDSNPKRHKQGWTHITPR